MLVESKRKSEKGATMIITLIAVLIFSILGAVIWQYGMNSALQVQKAYKQKQAYYIARSGAEAFSSYVINAADYETVQDTLNKIMDTSSSSFSVGSGKCTISLKREGTAINIEATGTIDGETAKAVLQIHEKVHNGFPAPIFKNVIFATNNIRLNGNVSITGGSLESNGEVQVNGHADPTYVENSTKVYPKVIYPANTSTVEVKVTKNKTYPINSSGNYKSIEVEKDGTLQINLSGGDMILVVDSLVVEGEMVLHGSGRLILYTKNLETRQNKGEINIYNEALPISSFLVLMPPEGKYKCNRFRGLLYAPDTEIVISGNQAFKGAMIAGKVTNSGNVGVTYVPEAADIPSSFFSGINVSSASTIEYSKGKWK